MTSREYSHLFSVARDARASGRPDLAARVLAQVEVDHARTGTFTPTPANKMSWMIRRAARRVGYPLHHTLTRYYTLILFAQERSNRVRVQSVSFVPGDPSPFKVSFMLTKTIHQVTIKGTVSI